MQANQTAADKKARQMVRDAYKAGNTVGFSLSRLIDLKISSKVIRAVYREPVKTL